MPFGLKNASALFQRKIQIFFNENQEFVLVYIDDLLIFSITYKEHIAQLDIFFRKVEQNDLILSKKKIEICKEKINFLGHEIGEGKIYLQDHIAKKILQFPDAMDDKVLQQFLGIVNYERNYIDNLVKLVGSLYAKLRKNGQKYFNSKDIKLVKIIEDKVKNIKEEILKEVKMKMNKNLKSRRKNNAKFDISFSDEDIMDIGGYGQKSEE
jgi:hypothetical protein